MDEEIRMRKKKTKEILRFQDRVDLGEDCRERTVFPVETEGKEVFHPRIWNYGNSFTDFRNGSGNHRGRRR